MRVPFTGECFLQAHNMHLSDESLFHHGDLLTPYDVFDISDELAPTWHQAITWTDGDMLFAQFDKNISVFSCQNTNISFYYLHY